MNRLIFSEQSFIWYLWLKNKQFDQKKNTLFKDEKTLAGISKTSYSSYKHNVENVSF